MINAKNKMYPEALNNSEAMAVTARTLTVHVFLPSGRCASVFASSTWTIGDLRLAAQDALACGFIRLCSAAGWPLDSMLPLQSMGVQDGDHMNAIVQSAQMASARGAFALFYSGGGLVGWGDQECADISDVREDLWGVQHLQATSRAFAAVLSDGRVVTYGDADFGGDSSRVQSELSDVLQIQATNGAFAAILADGSVVSWGRRGFGGDSSAVQDKLKSVRQIQATGGPLLPPPAPRRARRPPGPVLTKVQGAKGRKTYRAFSGLLHQDVLGALGLCADNSTGCELEKHVRRLVGSLPRGFALSILQTK